MPTPGQSQFAGGGTLDTAINLSMGVRVVTTTLATNLSNSEIEQVFLTDATGIPFRSTIVINDERIYCDGRFGDTLQLLTRGAEGTTPASHTAGATVTYYSAPRFGNPAIEDAVMALENALISNTPGFVKGTGTAHQLAVWTAGDTIADSRFFDDGAELRVGDVSVGVGIQIATGGAQLVGIGANGINNRTLLEVDDFSRQIRLSAGDIISISSAYQVAIGDNAALSNNTTLLVDDSAQAYFLNKLSSDGFVKTSGHVGQLVVDTTTYLTGNQTITLSGDVSGSGATAITTTIGAGKVTFAMLATSGWDGDVTLAADSSTKLPTQHAVKTYVDNLITGLRFKQDCRVASTANVNISGPGSSIDGVTLSSGDRVLLKNQSTATQNGAYVFNGSASAMTRATDADAGSELVSATFPIREGTANADTWWTVTNDSVTIGSTSIVFTQTAGAGTYTNGAGLSLTGNSFSISSGGVTNAMLAGSIAYSKLSLTGAILNADLAGSIAASKLVGTDIATLGTVTGGTWNATAISAVYGGTGLTSLAQGDLIYGSATNAFSALVKNTTATRYLSNTGTSNNPAWSQINLANGVTGSLPATNLVGTDIVTLGTVTTGTWDATKIGLAYGGTNADLSGTGGASKVLKQLSAGAAITVAQLGFSELSGAAAVSQQPTTDGCRVYKSSGFAAANGFSVVTFDSERYDNGSLHSTSSNTSRITIVTAGVYAVSAHVTFTGSASGAERQLRLLLNGTTSIARQNLLTGGIGADIEMSVGTVYRFAASDYIEAQVYQDTGGNLTIKATGNTSPEFVAQFLSP